MTVTNHSPAEDKVALFGALFRGREDVYPRRFESAATGRSGYQPACANEWLRGVCDKPKTRCALCGRRKFLPVTPETLRWHLSGEDVKGRPFVMGVYPLLEDEHCWFVAADFDKEGWREDVAALRQTCEELGLPLAVCQELRLAVELDGAQHFADEAAYRRDRRKDALLQENGYLVLRFLAEDVCERLNDVLDGILRALSHRQTRQEQPYSAPCTPRQVPTRAAACSHS